MRKWIILLLLIIVAVWAYNYIYHDHRDIASENAEYKMTALSLSEAFSKKTDKAQGLYLNKTIEVEGIITEVEATSITLDNLVWCIVDVPMENKLKIDSKINIKGRVIGYDDLLEQVKIDQCQIVN